MSIRRNLIVYLALFIALGGTSYAATQLARVQRTCYPRGSTTIAQNNVGRFYSAPGRNARRQWYYCVFTQRRPHRLPYGGNPDATNPTTSTATVAGRYLAFATFCPCPFHSVVVMDMVAGRRSFAGRTYAGERQGGLDFAVRRLVLKPNGWVAWIDRNVNAAAGSYVHRHDSTGTAIVDSGTGIDPNSLAAGGPWLYWTDAGSPRSAPFH